jgi:transcriptional regulator with XRE-family HTH domain
MLGWTQHQLAEAAKIAPGRIIWAETGRVKLTNDELQRIKDALARRAKEVADAVAND